MIESTLEFQPMALRLVVEAFFGLPNDIRPTFYSVGEDDVDIPILNYGKFLDSLARRESGFFLKGPCVTYDVSLAGSKSIICNCFLEVEPFLAKNFLMHMAMAQPVFGFACVPEEREHRNRVTIKQGINTIESWVGRDPQKYIPGFYWLTLLPEVLAEKHGVSLSVVEQFAQEHLEIEGGQHLFRFYDHPEDWKSSFAVTKLYSSLSGVFNVEKVIPHLANAKNFLELDASLRDWR